MKYFLGINPFLGRVYLNVLYFFFFFFLVKEVRKLA